MQKQGNILLDSGAQISLIRNETAVSLGLKGKNTSITITKVGGDEETIATKSLQGTSLYFRLGTHLLRESNRNRAH